MGNDTNRRLLMTIVGLGIALFCLDLYLPLGIGNGVMPRKKAVWYLRRTLAVP